jgi:hypothetical protein
MKVPSEGGAGGKRGHSAMEHWAETQEIKDAARHARRVGDRQAALDGLVDHDPDDPGVGLDGLS